VKSADGKLVANTAAGQKLAIRTRDGTFSF